MLTGKQTLGSSLNSLRYFKRFFCIFSLLLCANASAGFAQSLQNDTGFEFQSGISISVEHSAERPPNFLDLSIVNLSTDEGHSGLSVDTRVLSAAQVRAGMVNQDILEIQSRISLSRNREIYTRILVSGGSAIIASAGQWLLNACPDEEGLLQTYRDHCNSLTRGRAVIEYGVPGFYNENGRFISFSDGLSLDCDLANIDRVYALTLVTDNHEIVLSNIAGTVFVNGVSQ